MPQYCYQHPKTKKIIEVVQRMTEKHVYVDSKGVEWNRVFTVPQGSVKDKEPTNQQEFAEYTGKRKGSLGDMYDKSKELSEKRASRSIDGVDPVKRKYWKNYSKTRRGKKHPEQRHVEG
jgi:hypothetical protein